MDWTDITAFVVGVIAVGRAARLLVFDDFPPAEAVRKWYVRHSSEAWSTLFLCPFCLAPYLAAGDLAWYFLAGNWVVTAWWLVNLWAAGAYLAAIIVAYDQPD